MLLLDDFSGHWVQEAVDCAVMPSVLPMNVQDGLTLLCQDTDAVLIKSVKDRLRRHWVNYISSNCCARIATWPAQLH